jgi:hypothetical protein
VRLHPERIFLVAAVISFVLAAFVPISRVEPFSLMVTGFAFVVLSRLARPA